MTFLKRIGWVVPSAALAAGALALVPSLTASATPADLPVVEMAATTAGQPTGSDVMVDGESWEAMARRGSRRTRTFVTPSGNVIVTGDGVTPGTGPNNRPDGD